MKLDEYMKRQENLATVKKNFREIEKLYGNIEEIVKTHDSRYGMLRPKALPNVQKEFKKIDKINLNIKDFILKEISKV